MGGDVAGALGGRMEPREEAEAGRVADMARGAASRPDEGGGETGIEMGRALRALQGVDVGALRWRDHLRACVREAFGARRRHSRSRPSRSTVHAVAQGRGAPWRDGRARERTPGRMLVAFDSSGSVDDQQMASALAHAAHCAAEHGAAVEVAFCDTEVRGSGALDARATPATRMHEALLALARETPGGGGTSFVPVMDHADACGAKLLVFFTDLMGEHRRRKPGCPVVWCVHGHHEGGDAEWGVPYGKVVRLPMAGGAPAAAA